MKTKKNIILSFIKIFFFVDICLVLYSLLAHGAIWLLNTQVAFVSSLFISLVSFFSYKKNIQNRLYKYKKKENVLSEDGNKIDEIDEPFDLCIKEKNSSEDLGPEKIKEIINEEKSKLKKESFKNTFFSASAYTSIYRILAYVVLIFGFFALNNNKIFIAVPFLIGLGIVPLCLIVSSFILKLEVNQ